MWSVVLRLRRCALVLLLALGLVSTAFAHRAPSSEEGLTEAYVLAGGSLVDLCTGDGEDGLRHADCPACQLAAGAAPPAAAVSVRDADLIFVARIIAPRESRAVRSVLDPARGLRAPPLA